MVPPNQPDVTTRPADAIVTAAAHAVVASSSLETLIRPFLDVLHTLTGLDSTYLTEVRPELGDQVIRFADNRGELDIAEGLVVNWQESLCRRAIQTGIHATSDAATTFPNSPAQRDLGITSFVSVPVVGADNVVLGTLCGAADHTVPISVSVVDVMMMLARLIADQWERDRRHEETLDRALDAEERLRERASFLAEAEHKLKSPLTVIRGWSEMLTDEAHPLSATEQAEAHGIMRRAAADASRQLDHLLDEARSEVLSLQLDVELVQLADVVTEVTRQLHGAATAAHTVTAETVDPAIAKVDRDAIWQVLWHLAENAAKYSPAGGRIDLGSRRTEEHVVLTVTDEGLGVPTDVDLFAPFTRGSADQVGTIPGTGLGLHIVRNLVRAMGGTVTAEPRPDRGSVFSVTLPLVV